MSKRIAPEVNDDALPTEALEIEPRGPLRAIALLPSMATLGNLLCGVVAILSCLLSVRHEYHPIERAKPMAEWMIELFPSYITIGVYMIVLSMVFDALDGRLARLARRTSEFGAQLDSLADVVSFGVAPAMLFLTLLLQLAAPNTGEPTVSKLEWRIGLFCSLVYISCAAIRLARYNAENVRGEAAKTKFTGMPVPGAAGGFCGVLLLYEVVLVHGPHGPGSFDWDGLVRWAIGPLALAIGLLMVSRIEHVHVFNVYVRREQPLIHLIWVVAMIALAFYWLQLLLILLAFAYVLSGALLNLVRYRSRLRARAAAASLVSTN